MLTHKINTQHLMVLILW